jgi:transposase
LRDIHGIDVNCRTLQRKLCALGLSWSKIKPKKKTLKAYRLIAIQDFLIQQDLVDKSILSGNLDFVYVFTEESYMHQSHAMDHTYLPKDDKAIERKTGKGRRLIILHAITTDGPLCATKENGKPIDDLLWKADTCHPTPRANRKLSCETLWIAQSHTGDYHDNINSDMFMLWVEEKLVPVFEQQYLGKIMVLVADNAPYHHKRVIGSLASVSKKKIVEMMIEQGIEYINLPLTDKRMKLVGDEEEDRGDCIWNGFDWEEQNKRAGARDLRIANGEELKVAFMNYLRDNKPEMLVCKVEKFLHDRGYKVIWTPPYCPDLQPIKFLGGQKKSLGIVLVSWLCNERNGESHKGGLVKQ